VGPEKIKTMRNSKPSDVVKPVFVIGCPRSGTTIVHEVLAVHPDVAWFSSLMNRIPQLPILAVFSRLLDLPELGRRFRGVKPQNQVKYGFLNKFLPRPGECWNLWEYWYTPQFRSDMLTEIRPSDEQKLRLYHLVQLTLRYQAKSRFLAKLTGPPRMNFLLHVFPDAYFIHIIRDGRAVVNSLLTADFWRERGGLEKPWWNGLPQSYIQEWHAHGNTPPALAAVQWKYLIQLARREHKSAALRNYLEIRYEDFVRNPVESIVTILKFCELAPSARIESYLRTRISVQNMNFKWRDKFTANDLRVLNQIMGFLLRDLRYDCETDRALCSN